MKVYLGDGVYARVEHGTLILTTEVGDSVPTNEIYLEVEVYRNLILYVQKNKENIRI